MDYDATAPSHSRTTISAGCRKGRYYLPVRQPTTSYAMRAARALLLGVAILYAGDYAALRYRLARHGQPLGSIEIHRYYALHKAREKTTFMFAEPVNELCVHSLFPHLGHWPCWYLSRRTEQRIDYE